ncbi:MAG TPA: hypothetical protein EYP98_08325, partial [Planctomycetes bacterium]|nr:hypothetical protein [Planctomycetota bacterium]
MAALAALSLPVQHLSAQKVLTPEMLNTLQRVGGLSLAPDGKHLLFTISTPDIAANKSTTKVYVLNLMEARRKPTEVAVGRSPYWLPGGVAYAWVTKEGVVYRHLYEDGPDRVVEAQLRIYNVHTGALGVLSSWLGLRLKWGAHLQALREMDA